MDDILPNNASVERQAPPNQSIPLPGFLSGKEMKNPKVRSPHGSSDGSGDEGLKSESPSLAQTIPRS